MSTSAFAQNIPAAPDGPLQRPLNLGLPKQATQDQRHDTSKDDWDSSSATKLPPTLAVSRSGEKQRPAHLPYGAGYESRHQGLDSRGGGRGVGGHGGMGRGR